VIRGCAFGVRLLVVALLLVVADAGPAGAQSTSPSPARGPTVSGQVTGALLAGSMLTIGLDATMPSGWEALHLVEVSVLSGSQELDRLRFDIEDNKLTVGDQYIVVGTGAVATGDYLRASGADVVVTFGAANLSFGVDADVIKRIPSDARFVISVTGDVGETANAMITLSEPEQGGLTWGTVVTAVFVALLAGGFMGNVVATRRRPPPRLSVYGSIKRRIDDDRESSREPTA